MKKEEFLILLLARLIERGVPEDTAKKETEHVRTYLTESGMEELDISLDEMADGIISMLSDSSEPEKETNEIIIPVSTSLEQEGSVTEELEAAIAAMDIATPAAESTVEVKKEIPIVIEPISEEKSEVVQEVAPAQIAEEEQSEAETEPETFAAPEEEAAAPEDIPEPAVDAVPEPETQPIPDPIPEESPAPEPHTPPAPMIIDDEEVGDVEEYFPYDKKKRMKNNDSVKKPGNEWLYVAILVVTLPIVVALIAISLVLYLGFWIVFALAMIACIAVLVVFVTAGAIVSIVGIVYGVVQLITGQIPVGMFEVGLGVIVGAAVMFIGILVYNFAVRFIPFAMRLLAKLFRAGFRAVRGGYQTLKGAVNNI